ncbi:MAG TPA: hypothetical protein VFJ61_12270 [Solirubrobacterales bacterium]|nr:hypothetical protein [Solirubrobacterales bacterium]
MTKGNFAYMNRQEQRDLAQRLADDSEVFDFAKALEVVESRPWEVEKLLRIREENRKSQEEFARIVERQRRALIEDYG